jgi:serine/threonine-protein kinase
MEEEVTRVEAPGAKRATDAPPDEVAKDTDETTERELEPASRRASTERRRSAGTADRATSLSITTLRDTMHSQDAERTRGFVGMAAFVCVAISITLFFVRGDPTKKWVFAASMLFTAIACAWLANKLRDPLAYDLNDVLRVGYIAIVGTFCGINFFGFYSPAAVAIPFGLYFFGLAHSFGGTLIIYLLCAITYAALALPIGFGWIPDRGLVRVPELTMVETFMVVGAVEVIFFATYAIARLSRRATENALHEHDKAVRAIAGRDALLQEARMDLEGVLRARGLGRFTDETVGRYRLGEILGRGGMGEVYEARHIDSEEESAVKLLHPHVLGNGDEVRRFVRECKLASTLDVPNVVKVYATSVGDDPIPYIAMERLRGTDLSDHLRAHGRMKMRDVLRLIREVGRGLDAARKAEIVHRDIKPRNLFHAEVGAGKRPQWKILDFGVSKLGGEATLTQQHIVGTPSYMAPEQAEVGEVTHRTDLFSLGVIAYRALTGRPAFSADAPAAILYQVVHEMPPRPSQIHARLNDDVDLVLGIDIAKDPWDRFDSAEELADMLEKASKARLPGAIRERARRVLDKNDWA